MELRCEPIGEGSGRGVHRWDRGQSVSVCRACDTAVGFDEEKHLYLIHGRRVPSVSDILRPVAAAVYGEAPPDAMRNRALIGRKVHEASCLIDAGERVPRDIAEGIAGYIFAYKKFVSERRPDIRASEHIVLDAAAGYAGTVDRIAIISGEPWLLDIKTSSALHPELYDLQLYAYARAALLAGTVRLGILHLMPGGQYAIAEAENQLDRLEEVWTSLLSVASWLEQTGQQTARS